MNIGTWLWKGGLRMDNKYQQAWQKICDYAYGNEELTLEEFEDMNSGSGMVIQELVDKSVSKPPKGISVTHEGRVGNCPFCNRFIREKEHKVICDCGQKLQWPK